MGRDTDLLRDIAPATRIEVCCEVCGDRLSLYRRIEEPPYLVPEKEDSAYRPYPAYPDRAAVRERLDYQIRTARDSFISIWGTTPEEALSVDADAVEPGAIEEARLLESHKASATRPRAVRGPVTGAIHKVVRFGDSEKWVWNCRCKHTPQRRVDKLLRLKVHTDREPVYVLV